ncbi:MAG: hypothetical protein K9K66_15955 [Desulfarculaceae bacterium]|nr:hypothetical protein [Desulfarculaceae bacterium]MCF8073619.1 hypothetical protein [Desulfarculaceae bacterium]MCF8103149.1 hypothetical protein [Desulfarculaceae bacterium]MCF8115665.1 hypothetical protein [Desulfarculaceae bacterium]
MRKPTLPYENLGEGALDAFGGLLTWVFLSGIALVLLVVFIWIALKVFAQLGWYKPTGPLDDRMGRLLVLCVLGVTMGGTLALIFYWFTVDPSPEWPPR